MKKIKEKYKDGAYFVSGKFGYIGRGEKINYGGREVVRFDSGSFKFNLLDYLVMTLF